MTEAETSTSAAVAIAGESLGHDLLDTLIAQMSKLPGWDKAPVQQHDDAIRALREAVERLVRSTINILVGRQFPACVATLQTVSFGDGVKATLKLEKTAGFRHELADATGQSVVVIITDPDEYLKRMDDLMAKAPQGDLFGTLQAAGTLGDVGSCLVHDTTFPKGSACPECEKADPEGKQPGADQVVDDALAKAAKGGYGAGPRGTAEGAKNAADERRVLIAGLLDQLYIVVSSEIVAAWTDEQLATAYEYATRKIDYPHTRKPAPAFLPAPSPPPKQDPPSSDPGMPGEDGPT